MKRIVMPVTIKVVLLLSSSLGSIGAERPMQEVTVTPTTFNYLPLVVKSYSALSSRGILNISARSDSPEVMTDRKPLLMVGTQ